MARGRNHNRNRNSQIQSNQQQTQSSQHQQQHHNLGQNQQQQKQLSEKQPFNQQQQHPQISSLNQVPPPPPPPPPPPTPTPMQSTNALNAPVASINKQQPSSSNSNTSGNTSNANNNFDNNTPSPSIKSESYGHINKSNNQNNYENDESHSPIHNGPLDEEESIKAHLETNGESAATFNTENAIICPATATAISCPQTVTTYQMTMSNNNLTDFSHVHRNDDPQRCEHLDDNNNDDDDDDDDDDDEDGDDDDDDADDSNSAPVSGEHMRPFLQQREENGRQQLSTIGNDENDEQGYINRSPVIEHNVSVIAQVTDNNDHNNDDNVESSIFCATTTHNGKYDNVQLNKLTECDRVRVTTTATTTTTTSTNQLNTTTAPTTTTATTMGQKNTKGDASSTPHSSSRSPSPIPPFRESSVNRTINGATGSNNVRAPSPSVSVPTITVVDCSSAGSAGAKNCAITHNENEEYYDFENHEFNDRPDRRRQGPNKEFEVEGQHGVPTPTSSYRSPSPTSLYSQLRYNYVKLEDVPEQEEEEEDEEEDDNNANEDEEEDDGAESAENTQNEDEGNETDEDPSTQRAQNVNAPSNSSTYLRGVNLDNDFQCKHSVSLSPDRHHPKSVHISYSNSADSNLSTSFPDSGMGESVASASNSRFINTNDADYDSACSNMHRVKQQHQEHFKSFVRDGSSTDCDETLMQCEDIIDFVETTPEFLDPSERFVCIESISLPDVVVESTNSSGNLSNASTIGGGGGGCGNAGGACAGGAGGGAMGGNINSTSVSGADRDIININGATGNSIGNVHFIPIRVEGGSGRSSPRKQSVDDSVVGSGNATIEIIEDVTELQQPIKYTAGKPMYNDAISEKLKKELLEQKTQFSVQLEDAHKNVNNLQTKINDMQMKIENLELELSTKTWNVERLQGELSAAQRDDEYVRKKLKLLEDEKTNLRHRYSDCEDELKKKYDELEVRYNELQEKYQQTQSLASSLQTQLAQAQSDVEESREEVKKIRSDLEEQIRLLKNALENSENERKICEDKWQREFEMLRTHNMDREESIMTDCEWQLRQTQKQCKERIERSESCRKEALGAVELLEEELESLRREIDDLKIYQAQVKSLRGVVNDQAQSIETLMQQIETLKKELSTAKESLEEQIEAVRKIKFHCDNALIDKERQMIYRIDEVRNEAAAFWEDKLYTEMTRLKHELESVYVEDRRDELDKLQAEHVEELKALTNRYTDNEDELRVELAEVQERLDLKSQEFIELREKSDNALLQTRMHLDRADRDYQKAMCQEEERREALEASLREEFETEKEEMESKFRLRLQHVKEEFSKELQINSQELTEQHTRELEKVKAKLMAEKDQAVQELQERHRKQLQDREEQIKEFETRHKRDLKDLKAAYDAEKAALDKRDISNANEIEQLHRKCRCLTNLFEEMRMRYERRDPRPEDLREIAELRTRCESQERDMYLLTDRLREMQNQMNEMQQNGINAKKAKQIKKPPPKTLPTNCDVIYEENEERESPPPTPNSYATEDTQNDDDLTSKNNDTTKMGDKRPYGKKLITQSEDDTHMITAM